MKISVLPGVIAQLENKGIALLFLQADITTLGVIVGQFISLLHRKSEQNGSSHTDGIRVILDRLHTNQFVRNQFIGMLQGSYGDLNTRAGIDDSNNQLLVLQGIFKATTSFYKDIHFLRTKAFLKGKGQLGFVIAAQGHFRILFICLHAGELQLNIKFLRCLTERQHNGVLSIVGLDLNGKIPVDHHIHRLCHFNGLTLVQPSQDSTHREIRRQLHSEMICLLRQAKILGNIHFSACIKDIGFTIRCISELICLCAVGDDGNSVILLLFLHKSVEGVFYIESLFFSSRQGELFIPEQLFAVMFGIKGLKAGCATAGEGQNQTRRHNEGCHQQHIGNDLAYFLLVH